MEKICEIERKQGGGGLAKDLLLFTAGFLFTRCHLIFGAHPIGLAFLAALPFGVWSALLGAVVGGFSMGLSGIIFAASAAITVFLRAAVSADKRDDGALLLFGENLLLRMSLSLLGGFVAAVYEVMLSGLGEKTVAFGVSMIIAPPILTFLLSGLFSTGINSEMIFSGRENILSLSGLKPKEKYEIIFFVISAIATIFFIGLSLREVNAFGISAIYIFSGVVTLLTAKRFGAIYAMAAGLASSISADAMLSVGFGLAGLCGGALFSLGTGYAIVIGGVALAAFSGYSSGLSGLLSTLPEYVISTVVALPILRLFDPGEEETEEVDADDAKDMLGTMALVYRKEYSGRVDAIGRAISSLSETLGESGELGDDYKIFASMVEEARQQDLDEVTVDNSVTEKLTEAIRECGFDGVIRAFGKHRPHFILAGADGGRRITSFEVRHAIESAAGVKLSAPTCYKKGKTSLMECGVRRKLSASFAIAGISSFLTQSSFVGIFIRLFIFSM